MNSLDIFVDNHIHECDKSICRICDGIYKEYSGITSQKAAMLKYQRKDKYKQYKRQYYLKNREEILKKYHNKTSLKL